jgi:hypothetical protein
MKQFVELRDGNRMWATVEHSGDICKFVIYNEANGSTALVIPRRLVAGLAEALNLGISESETPWDLQTR